MNTLNTIIVFLCCFLVVSCTAFEEPAFEKIENVEIINVSTQQLECQLDLVFYNPNAFALDLAEADLNVSMAETALAEVHQTYESTMPGQSRFSMPVNIILNLQELYGDNPITAMTKGLELMQKRELELQFKGSIKVGKGKTKISVPIDKIDLIRF